MAAVSACIYYHHRAACRSGHQLPVRDRGQEMLEPIQGPDLGQGFIPLAGLTPSQLNSILQLPGTYCTRGSATCRI